MNRFPGILINIISGLRTILTDALHRAVMAPQYKNLQPRWRNIGQPVLPYHYLQPVPLPATGKRK